MKKLLLYLIAVVFLASCGKHLEVYNSPFAADDDLRQIDSLLQHDADSKC